MKALLVVLLMASTASAESASIARGARYSYETVDVTNALATVVNGIGDDGRMVGAFTDAERRQHGFILTRGTVNIVDYPGAALTAARGIAPNGDVVGSYRLAGEPAVNLHGFLLSHDGTFSRKDFRGSISTIAQRILAGGQVVGCAHDQDQMMTMRGVILSGDAQSESDVVSTMHNGATPDLSVIVGLYTDMEAEKGRAYAIVNGKFVPFDYPGSLFTAAWDVSQSEAIVGVYQDAAGAHGFLLEGGTFTSIDFPAALETRAFGINARGDIVGSYLDAARRTHGFVARRRLVVPVQGTRCSSPGLPKFAVDVPCTD